MTTRPPARVVAGRVPASGVPLSRLVGSIVGIIAISTLLTGMFLPWLSSGQVTRNSYQVAGTLDRFRLIDSALLDAVLAIWPFLGPAVVIAVLLAVVRLWRIAGAVAVVVGAIGAAGAVTAQVKVGTRSAFGVSLDTLGPSTVTIGGILLVLAGGLLWLPTRDAIRLSARRAAGS